jgi:hypothetical protein
MEQAMKNVHAETHDTSQSFDPSEVAVNCVQFDDQGRETSNETVPLEHFFKDYGQTSEVFLARRQKRAVSR